MWFPFIIIKEHNSNILKPKQVLITWLFKVFAMFELRLINCGDKLEAIAIRCINCKKGLGLYLGTSTLEEMITKFMLNAILHQLGMSWIIWSKKEMKYEIYKINHQYWLNKGPKLLYYVAYIFIIENIKLMLKKEIKKNLMTFII